ncbi:MAG: ERAP1-like C-terminal domain-containing protein, partial [Nocardioidaceae bacterium]|nr:ERAP1-like C-terminal domain-containing protein [Nocardioidaceae bacterium]
LNESFAEYLGVRVTADATQYADAWEDHGYARRQWGLVADRAPSTHPVAGNGAEDASTALQNFDGISYMKGSAILRQLATRLGDEAFLGGTVDHFERHFFGNATMADLVSSWERASGTDLADFTDGWLMSAGVDLLSYDRTAGVLRRTPPADHPSRRSHACRIAVGDRDGWVTQDVEIEDEAQPVVAPAGSAVLVDPYADTWAVTHVDETSACMLTALMPTLADTALRAGVWTALMSSFHDAALSPRSLVDVMAAALPTETSDAAVTIVRRSVDRLASVAGPAILDRIHLAARTRAATATAGSELQLAAFRVAVATGRDSGVLRGWLTGAELPDGVDVDLDLRWLVLGRLAELGATDRDELKDHLEQQRTAESHVAHVRAVCSLPDPEAKAWAWQHFTGELDAPNYDLEAAAIGLWRPGQEELTADYAERYFAEVAGTAAVRQGWVLAESAGEFFPITAVSEATLERARALLADESVDPGIRRMVVDQTDAVERRLRIRKAFGASA